MPRSLAVQENANLATMFANYIFYSLPHYLSIISLGIALTLSSLIVFLFIVLSLKAHREHGIVPKTLPWSGRQHGQIFASAIANYRELVDSVRLFKEGYHKVIPVLDSRSRSLTDQLSIVFETEPDLRRTNLDEGPSNYHSTIHGKLDRHYP